ncbi:uncharacterized protein LOC133893679 [Phragmites australis]|uniref:uncharacterized protein LOC133893679 n=1 Tax=Phragmites australis TaxID=29695 RepID=UPI002D7657B4|nr:uncharacterized protein LOC133893679 [Phragmites australis]
MPTLRSCNTLLLSLLLLLASSAASFSFSLDFFPGAIAQLALSGAANATSGAVNMASPSARVQYRNPIVVSSLAAGAGFGFSTYFSFALSPQPPAASLAFFLTPSPRSPPALAVVFSASHVRVDLAGRTALQTQSQSHTPGTSPRRQRLHSWIDYNATTATLHVRLSTARLPNPPPVLLSYPLDLSPVLRRGPMLVGFQFQAASSSAGNCSLFSWAFRASHGAPYQMHSQPLNPADLLTTPPPERVHRAADRRYNHWGAAVSLLFAAACGAMVTFFVLFLWYSVASRRRPITPVEYPMHPSNVVYEKIVLVGVKDDAAAADNDVPPSGRNK